MARHYSTRDVSLELDISEQTVRLWSKTFRVPYTKSSGNIRFSQEALETFETIKALRAENSGFDTIKRHIGKPELPEPIFNSAGMELPPPKEPLEDLIKNLESLVEHSIQNGIKSQTELAERYAQATYRVGELDATVQIYKERIQELERSKAEMEAFYQAEIARLKAQLAGSGDVAPSEDPKSWWKKFAK